jgi:hypothetical protein
MRLFITNLLATALVLFGASVASASTLTMQTSYAGETLGVGDTVTVELIFDATETGIQLFGSNVLFDPTVLAYVPTEQTSLGVPTYILYGMSGMAGSSLYAQQNPWVLWPGLNQPGFNQVNVNWADPSFNGTFVTGSNLFIASLTFQVIDAGDGIGEIVLTIDAEGGIFQVSGDPNSPLTIANGNVNVITPEPTTAVLVGLGLLGLGVAGRRR